MTFLPIVVSVGSILTVGLTVGKQRRNNPLIKHLIGRSSITPIDQLKSKCQHSTTKATAWLLEIDNRYQRFIQKQVDPLLGKKRHTQLQEMLSGNALSITLEERLTNQRLALGVIALAISIVGQLFFPFIMPIAIALGLAAMSNNYYGSTGIHVVPKEKGMR